MELLPWSELGSRRPLAERIAAVTAQAIAEGDIAPGEVLTEVEVAGSHGASRTPVREAMVRLERWGLVRLAPKKGALVTAATAREQRELLAVRGMLESAAVDALDDDSRAALLADLDATLARQAASIHDPRAFALHDYTFHLQIIRHGDNRVVAGIADELAPRLYRLTRLAVDSAAGNLDAFHAEHMTLADAVRAGDAAGFREQIGTHLLAGHSGYEVAP